MKSAHENSAPCFQRSTFPLHPLFPSVQLASCAGAACGWAVMGSEQCLLERCATWERGEGRSPGDGQAGGKAGWKYGACVSYSSLFGILIAVLEEAIFLWQRSYGSFPSLTSKVLKLMVFYCFFSSSPLITWPPYIAAADKIYTWRKIPLNILFFTFSLFPNTTLKARNAKLHIIY